MSAEEARAKEVKEAHACPAQMVTFQVGDQVYGLGILDVHEVIRYREPEFPPGEPPWVLGVIHLRGEILPAVDARSRLGLPEKEPESTAVYIVLQKAGKHVAVLVDAILDVVQVGQDVELDRPPGVDHEGSPIAGFVRLNNRTVALLRAEAFVPTEESVA
jgi:purine-binding chemotaxis protein CheW